MGGRDERGTNHRVHAVHEQHANKNKRREGRERLKSSVAASDPTTGKLKCFDRQGRSRLKGPSESSDMAVVCLCLPSEELNGRLPDTQCVRERERGGHKS